jgi:hypothetical protein
MSHRAVAPSEVTLRARIRQTSASQLRVLHLMWWALGDWFAHTPVDYGPADGRRPEPRATGSRGGAAVPLPPVEPAPPATTDFCEVNERLADARYGAQLFATLPSPDREIIMLRTVAGVSIPDIAATLGVTPTAIHHAQLQSLSALRPAATAHGPPPATRKRVVLLPHAQTEPTDTRPNNRRTEGGNGMNHSGSPPQPPTRGDDTTPTIAASTQWHDAELAMKVARHSFDRWLTAGHDDTPSLAVLHAYHTHTALHEAARSITMLIETFRVEATALITPPARDTDTTQRW